MKLTIGACRFPEDWELYPMIFILVDEFMDMKYPFYIEWELSVPDTTKYDESGETAHPARPCTPYPVPIAAIKIPFDVFKCITTEPLSVMKRD